MTLNQFCRLSNELQEMPAAARAIVETMAAGDLGRAAELAGGRGSDAWWAAEFFVKKLADHGATEPPKFTSKLPAPRPRTVSMFAD
jgi:hypothetical protein